LDTRNGRLRWKKDLVAEYGAVKPTHGFAGPPVVQGDLLLLTVNSAGLALNQETGELVWDSPAPPPPATLLKSGAEDTTGTNYPAPVLYEHTGKRCALFSGWEGIISVEAETGKPALLYAWEIYSGNDVPDPVVSGDKVLVSSYRSKHNEWLGVLLQVEGDTSKVVWKSPHLYSNITTPVVVAGYIYAGFGGPGDGRADLRCVELQTGKLQWVNKASEGGTTACVSLTAANGKLIVLNGKGWLYIAEASPAGFNVLSRCDVFKGEQRVRQFWSPPVLCNGRIYCRNFSGELLCIDVAI
jgi:outer membrane protein assembly factor BamB